MPDDPQGFDWSALLKSATPYAAALIPAAVGAVAGGRGAAGIGAATGFSEGMRGQVVTDQEYQKQRAQVQEANQRAAIAQQRTDLEARQQTAQEAHWRTMEAQADRELQERDLRMQKIRQEMAESVRTEEGRKELIKTLSPEEAAAVNAMEPSQLGQFLVHRADQQAKQKELKTQMEATGRILTQYGLPKALVQNAIDAGPQVSARVFEVLTRSKTEGKPKIEYDAQRGVAIMLDANNPSNSRMIPIPGIEAKTKDTEVAETNTFMDNARATVQAQFTGPMGAINMSDLGKTPEDIAKRFSGLVNAEAREQAARAGRGYLFDPKLRLEKDIMDGKVKNTTDAVGLLLRHGVPEDQVMDVAREVVGKAMDAAAKNKRSSDIQTWAEKVKKDTDILKAKKDTDILKTKNR